MGTLQTELIDKGLHKACTGEVEQKNTRTRNKPKEKLTDRELRELMGQNRDTYKRKGGAIRKR